MSDERKGQSVAQNAEKGEQGLGVLPWAEKWLSAERLAPYLKACGGDTDKAMNILNTAAK